MRNRNFSIRLPGALRRAVALTFIWLGTGLTAIAAEKVTVTRLPEGAVQPNAVVDHGGNVHVVYLRGEASACDIYYSCRPANESAFSETRRVNSQEGAGLATGVVRGPDMAVDHHGNVHIAWIGSNRARPQPADGSLPILYAKLRSGQENSEEQLNVVTWATGVDGGAAITVDSENQVAIVWHAGPDHAKESARSVFATISKDSGSTWPREERILKDELGACSCCDLGARFNSDGELQFVFRSAIDAAHRNVYFGTALGTVELVQEWELNSCPMSTFAFTTTNDGEPLLAWDRSGELYIAATNNRDRISWQPSGESTNRKHPAVAVSPEGEVLVAWTEGTSWGKGGRLCWQVFDENGHAISGIGRRNDLPVWGRPAAVYEPGRGFLIFY